MSKGYLKCKVCGDVDSNFCNQIMSHCTGNYVFEVLATLCAPSWLLVLVQVVMSLMF